MVDEEKAEILHVFFASVLIIRTISLQVPSTLRGMGLSQDSWSELTEGKSHTTILSFAINFGERRRKSQVLQVMSSAFPSNHFLCWGAFFQELDEHLLASGKQRTNPFVCACSFPSLIKLSWSWPTNCLHFCPSDSLPPSDGRVNKMRN